VSRFFVKKVIETAVIECPTSCLSGTSRQEMEQIVSFFRGPSRRNGMKSEAEIQAACLAGKGAFSQDFSW
jgi:hypothetical protein